MPAYRNAYVGRHLGETAGMVSLEGWLSLHGRYYFASHWHDATIAFFFFSTDSQNFVRLTHEPSPAGPVCQLCFEGFLEPFPPSLPLHCPLLSKEAPVTLAPTPEVILEATHTTCTASQAPGNQDWLRSSCSSARGEEWKEMNENNWSPQGKNLSAREGPEGEIKIGNLSNPERPNDGVTDPGSFLIVCVRGMVVNYPVSMFIMRYSVPMTLIPSKYGIIIVDSRRISQ